MNELEPRWYDLVTFVPGFLDNKTVVIKQDVDGVFKPFVYDRDGKQVYPPCQ